MAIVETLTVELGSSIAKAILKIWLKDYSIAADVTSDLLGLLKGKTLGALAQQRAKRQFETIGEKVAENLLPLFETENTKLDENSQISVALRISQIIGETRIDAKLLAENNLDPNNLLDYLKELHPARTRDFSENETEFFERIFSEVCQNIVDVAAELPSFTDQTLAEVLKRETDLIQRTTLILDEIKRIRLSSERTDVTNQASLFEAEYRRAIVRNLDEVELFGADVSRASKRHRLSVAYVTLTVEEITAHGERNNVDEPLNADERNAISVDQVINNNQRLFIRGDAGSGKTTLLQWIAVRAASGTFEGSLGFLNSYTPFFIRLRQCNEQQLPAPQEFVRLATPVIADRMPKGWVHERLQSGKAIVLIDGLDEVTQLKRENVRKWLRELVSQFSDVRYILSSRPPAANEGWLLPEGFKDAMMQPMTMNDIFNFIDHWHDAVREELQDETEKIELESLGINLKNVIQNNRPIYNLATTPLLCAMICALHRDRKRQLPKDRIELYEACTYMLLERREIERQIDYSDYPNLTYRQKRAFLEGFAYWLMKNGWSSVGMERVDSHFDVRLKNADGLSRCTGKDIRRLFVERSGMLREPVKGYVHFAHRTFQEYLAAQAVLNEDDIGVLVKNAHDDQWKEVVILAAGLADSQKSKEELIRKIINRGDAEQKHRHQLHLLAVGCLETPIFLSQEIKQEIEKRLTQLMPPKNMTEAREWASAGELAIPYLVKGAKSRAVVAAACVRALAFIGGDLALNAIKNFAHDERQTVTNEVLRGIEFFDKEQYAQIVLSENEVFASNFTRVTTFDVVQHLPYLKNLFVDTTFPYHFDRIDLESMPPHLRAAYDGMIKKLISDLRPLTHLRKLESLTIKDCRKITSLRPLIELNELRELRLGNLTSQIDLSYLRNLKSLSILEISGDVQDLSCIENLTNLTYLELKGCEHLKDLSFLENLENLSSLIIENCNSITHIPALKKLKRVKTLSFGFCQRLRDISGISWLGDLRMLKLSGCQSLDDISVLSSSKLLESLSLSGCELIADIGALENLNLQELSLVGCKNVQDISPLSNNISLRYLSFAGCILLNNLSPLGQLKDLKSLSLFGCKNIQDVTPLKELENLTVLDLGFCPQIYDISVVQNLRALKLLSLAGNERIQLLNPKDFSGKLSAVIISGCKNLDSEYLLQGNNGDWIWDLNYRRVRMLIPDAQFIPLGYQQDFVSMGENQLTFEIDPRQDYTTMIRKNLLFAIERVKHTKPTNERGRELPYLDYYWLRISRMPDVSSAINPWQDSFFLGENVRNISPYYSF